MKKQKKKTEEQSIRKGTPFINITTGILFLLTGIICVSAAIAIGIYSTHSTGSIINMIVLVLMSIYFFYKAPYYFRNRKNRS